MRRSGTRIKKTKPLAKLIVLKFSKRQYRILCAGVSRNQLQACKKKGNVTRSTETLFIVGGSKSTVRVLQVY